MLLSQYTRIVPGLSVAALQPALSAACKVLRFKGGQCPGPCYLQLACVGPCGPHASACMATWHGHDHTKQCGLAALTQDHSVSPFWGVPAHFCGDPLRRLFSTTCSALGPSTVIGSKPSDATPSVPGAKPTQPGPSYSISASLPHTECDTTWASAAPMVTEATPAKEEPQSATGTQQQQPVSRSAQVLEALRRRGHGRIMMVFATWGLRCGLRVFGLTRKGFMGQANQAANHEPLYIRQATVWLPLLSLYFASSLMIADARRTRLEWGKGNTPVAALFATSFACDVVDVAAQLCIINNVWHISFGSAIDVMLPYSHAADQYQLLIAAVSFALGLSGELLTVMREKRDTLMIQEQKNTAVVDPISPTNPTAKDKAA